MTSLAATNSQAAITAQRPTGTSFESRSFAVLVGVCLLPIALFTGRHLGSDTNFDLLSYHAYIGEAALAGRLTSDVAPAGLGSFHNPLLDLPGALALRQSVRLFTVWLSIQQWVCWLALWGFVRAVLRERSRGTQMLALAFALTGSAAISLSVTSFGDWPVAAALLASMAALINAANGVGSAVAGQHRLFVGGLFGACALAAKLTAAPFLIGLTVTALVFVGSRARTWAAGLAAGITVMCGPWWIYLQRRFGNPFFPYYNTIFKSPAGPTSSFDDSRFGASSLQDLIRLPVEFARGTTRYGELLYRDLRWIGVVCALVVWMAVPASSTTERRVWRGIGVFGCVGYLLWLIGFGIYRYALVLELLASVFIVAVISTLRPRIPPAAVALALSVALAFQVAPNWGRSTPLRVKLPQPTNGKRTDRVLLADMGPTAYLVRSLAPGTSLASIQGFVFGFYPIEGELGLRLRRFVADGIGNNSLRIVINPATELQPIVGQLGIAPDMAACQGFAGPYGPLAICPTVRVPS